MEPLTTMEAFEAMRSFVAQFASREPEGNREAFRFLLVWTEMEPDGQTSDPAQWHDWVGSVAEARARLASGQRLEIP